MMLNLETYLTSLNASKSPLQIRNGFLHDEPEGVKAIDQSGGQRNLTESRLYVYPELATEILHVMSIGTKQKQSPEIKECLDYVRSIKKLRKGQKNG